MLRTFLKDSSIYAASAVISRGIGIFLLPIYTRLLSPLEYGALDLLMIVYTLSNYLVTIEVSQGLARSYPEARTVEDRCSCVSTAAWFVLVTNILFVVVGISVAPTAENLLFGSTRVRNVVSVMVLAAATNNIFFLLQDLLRWQLKPAKYACSSITYSLVSATAGATAVVFFKQGIIGVFGGLIVGALAGLLVACANGAADYWKMTFDRIRLGEMIKYSAPQVLSSITAYSALYADRFFIKGTLGLEAVGVYGVGARVASVVSLLMSGFQAGYIPLVFNRYSQPDTPAQMARIFRHFLVGAFTIVLVLSAYSKDLISLIATPQYNTFWYTVPMIAAGILLANMFIFMPGVFIARKTKLTALFNVTTALLNIALIIFLIPNFGVMGIATATLVSSFFIFLCYATSNAVFYPINFGWLRIAATAILVGCFAGILIYMQADRVRMAVLIKPVLLFACILLSGLLLAFKDIRRCASELKQQLRQIYKAI